MWFLNWRAEENLVVNNKENVSELSVWSWIMEETGLETCWRDRRNLVEICDVTKILFWSATIDPSMDY